MTTTKTTTTSFYSVLAFPPNSTTGKAYRSIDTARRAAHRTARTACTVRIGRHDTAEQARRADISDTTAIETIR